MSPTTNATVFVTPPLRRLRASVFGRNRSRFAAESTASRVVGETLAAPP